MFQTKKAGFLAFENQMVDDCFTQIAEIESKSRLKAKIYDAVIGKTLIEELSKLDPNASRSDYSDAEHKAKNKAELITKIMVSGVQAEELAKTLSQSVKGFQLFYKKYFTP